MAEHHETGNAGEKLAADYLLKKGYVILARNYRYKKAEIDLIAQANNILVFVEVKTRSSQAFGYPEEAVSHTKINLFHLTAEHYINETNWRYDIRFDIIAITKTRNQTEIYHIEDAFH